MQHLEVSCAVRRLFKSLGFKGLMRCHGTALAYATHTKIIVTTMGQLGYFLDFWKLEVIDHNILDSVVSVLNLSRLDKSELQGVCYVLVQKHILYIKSLFD